MSETSESKTKRRMKAALNQYQPRFQTSIMFDLIEPPLHLIDHLREIKDFIRLHHRNTPLIWWHKAHYYRGQTIPMVMVFSTQPLDLPAIKSKVYSYASEEEVKLVTRTSVNGQNN